MENSDTRKEKCKTRFQNIRESIINGKNNEYIFQELYETKKCDDVYNFKNVRDVAFKKINNQILEKLEQKLDLTEKEFKTVDREGQRLGEYLKRSIKFNISQNDECLRKVSP